MANNQNNEIVEEAKKVRVRYSALVNYLSQIYRLAIALGFSLIVIRKLTVEEYGLLTTIMGIVNILVSIVDIWGFWITRFHARGKKEYTSTGFGVNLIYAPIASLSLIILGIYYDFILGWGFEYFLLASLIPLFMINVRYLRAIAFATRPYIDGKAGIIRETSRFIAGYVFVTYLLMKLYGAIMSIIVSTIVAVISYIFLFWKEKVELPRPSLSKKCVADLIKNGYISTIMMLSSILNNLERPIATSLTLNTTTTAYLGVAYIPRSIIYQSRAAITSGLTAKLLRIPSKEDVEDVLRLGLILNVGMVFLLVSLAIPILSLFKEQYVSGYILFILYSIESLIITISEIFATTAISTEKIDLFMTGIKLAETSLFKIPFFRLIRGIIAVVVGSLAMYILLLLGISDPVILVSPYPILWFVTSVPYLLYTYMHAKSKIAFKFPKRELLASVVGGIAMSIYYYVSGVSYFVVESFWRDFPRVAMFSIPGIVLYLVIVLGLSSWTRELIKKGLRMYLNKF